MSLPHKIIRTVAAFTLMLLPAPAIAFDEIFTMTPLAPPENYDPDVPNFVYVDELPEPHLGTGPALIMINKYYDMFAPVHGEFPAHLARAHMKRPDPGSPLERPLWEIERLLGRMDLTTKIAKKDLIAVIITRDDINAFYAVDAAAAARPETFNRTYYGVTVSEATGEDTRNLGMLYDADDYINGQVAMIDHTIAQIQKVRPQATFKTLPTQFMIEITPGTVEAREEAWQEIERRFGGETTALARQDDGTVTTLLLTIPYDSANVTRILSNLCAYAKEQAMPCIGYHMKLDRKNVE